MASYAVRDLTGYLCGVWELDRDIVAGDGTALGSFHGTARFSWRDGELRYDEYGELRLADYRGSAARTLHYRQESPSRCTVWFDDGHFFHDLRLDTGLWRVHHPCRADTYHGAFEALDADHWRQCWQATGPEKTYATTTLFTRTSRHG